MTDTQLRVVRGRVDSVTLYEVKEDELQRLEDGQNGGLLLNFAIAFISIGFSAWAAIATAASFANPYTAVVFVVVTVGGLLAGIVLGIMWFVSRKSNKRICDEIRARVKQTDFSMLPGAVTPGYTGVEGASPSSLGTMAGRILHSPLPGPLAGPPEG